MTPIERAARAACEAAGYDWIENSARSAGAPDILPVATDWTNAVSAALVVLREPSKGMRKAVTDAADKIGAQFDMDPDDVFRIMIDAVLKGR